ncbi:MULTISPECIES: GFA family protein [Cysteiniphilum]|uniref:GFA family protein n=1 Tax=Cysteiniphilum TaxID=2056696 RepID=UPI00177C5B14|nr:MULTISPECIES: GFA family protein [Cysteiniphilum]
MPSSNMPQKVNCSCLCQRIRFSCDASKVAAFCHCSICQKSHGTPFAAQLSIKPQSLMIEYGEQYLKSYASSHDLLRIFCSHCGSRLYNISKDRQSYASVALSAIDNNNALFKIKAHVCTDTKAEYFQINDSIKQYPDFFGINRK